MPNYNDKQKIIEHYDLLSPHYRKLWGEHLHHGYWTTGLESKEEAQEALTVTLAEAAQIEPGAAVLDVGCGFGGSSIYLASRFKAKVTGITISPVQADMARQYAERDNLTASFLVMDADNITLQDRFDVVWSIEAISHFGSKANFFSRAVELLKPGGTLALIDWFKQEDLSPNQYRRYIAPIERGMLVELGTMADYRGLIRGAGLDVVHTRDLSEACARTWDLTLELIKTQSLWQLAKSLGVDFVRFVRSFRAMRRGFASGAFVFGMIVARARREDVGQKILEF
jgi:tocopherol O-methyltransferase